MAVSEPTAERDRAGRFLPGNQVARGHSNPWGDRVVEWKKALADSIKPADLRAVAIKLVDAAKAGEPWAVRELLDRTCGPASAAQVNIGATGAVVQFVITPAPGPQVEQQPHRPTLQTEAIDVTPTAAITCGDSPADAAVVCMSDCPSEAGNGPESEARE